MGGRGLVIVGGSEHLLNITYPFYLAFTYLILSIWPIFSQWSFKDRKLERWLKMGVFIVTIILFEDIVFLANFLLLLP